MSLTLPQYNGKDNKVMLAIVPVFAFLFNLIAFGDHYFSGWPFFLSSTFLTALSFGGYFILCGGVAVMMKMRFPEEKRILLRLFIVISTFLTMSGLFIYGMLLLYETIPYFEYHFSERDFVWAYFVLGITNIFITFLMEGISRYQEWEASWKESENLNQAFKKSQLDGLKSQVNPHFLFNSLNSLSSLIQEDEEKAERFLDEMSKVYRYMLRNEEQWVSLGTELKFVQSYLHLLGARFGEALQVEIDIPPENLQMGIAPLTLQVIIENAIMQNVISKAQPLCLSIEVGDGALCICNNLQPKTLTEPTETEAGLDHLVAKYRLLKNPISVEEPLWNTRLIRVPLVETLETTLS